METLQVKLSELHNLDNEIEGKVGRKNELKGEIMLLIKENKWEDKKFAIGNRRIRCHKEVTKGGITQKYLMKCLKEHFQNTPAEAELLYAYILDNRPTSERESLEIKKAEES